MLVRCPQCGYSLTVPDDKAGKKGRCPQAECSTVFVLKPPKKVKQETTKKTSTKKPAKAPKAEDDWWDDIDDLPTEEESLSPRKRKKESAPVTGRSRKSNRSKKTKSKKKSSNKAFIFIGAAAVLVISAIVTTTSGLIPLGGDGASSGSVSAEAPDEYQAKIIPYFKKYCFECHSNDFQEADLNLEQYTSVDSILAKRKKWERVYDMIRVGAMPPSEGEQPTKEEEASVAEWLEKQLYYVDCDLEHDPGRVTIRRLNRSEYNNTTRDLLGFDLNPSRKFPADDVGYGFDNIGDVLTISSLLMERYLDAAEELSEVAVFSKVAPRYEIFTTGKQLTKEGQISASGDDEGVVYSSVGKLYKQYRLPESGNYKIRLNVAADQAGKDLAELKLKLNGKQIELMKIPGDHKYKFFEFQQKMGAGKQTLEMQFSNDFYDGKAKNPKRRDRNIYLKSIQVSGPIIATNSQSKIREQVLATKPKGESASAVKDAAKKFLKPFLRRAFRRAVEDEDLEKYSDLAVMVFEREKNYERAIQIAVQGVLVAPQFLFRIEDSRKPDDSSSKQRLDDFELASRISYFLWSSMPDDELLDLAEQNKLNDVETLKKQVQRMLKDPRSNSLSKNFAGQWLGLRLLNESTPDKDLFKGYDAELKAAMWKESEMFFDAVLREDRNILDFLDGRFTFVNEPLAKHYGMEGIKGKEFQRVDLKGTKRAGVLSHASILTITSYPTRTSPVKRGEWVLENLLDQPPPEAPPVVPSFDETANANPGLSFRMQLELHRKDPTCASCHKVMDQLGFGLENYDAVGKWRDYSDNLTVDPSGELPGGVKFNGPLELLTILREKKDDFARCLTKKMMTYALGRGVEFYDRCAIDKITTHLAMNEYRMSELIMRIVTSEPFMMQRGDSPLNIAQKETNTTKE